MSVGAVVVAAGKGLRFGSLKQLASLDGRALWEWARDALVQAGCDPVVVVGPVPGGIPGGRRRRDSVRAGLERIDTELVLVHDAVRPLASADLARRVIERLRLGDVAGVVPALAVRDTIKRVREGRVVETLHRPELVAVQTPQGFVTQRLLAAHGLEPGWDAPDDAALIERAGGIVAIVEGEPHNLKVTYPDDLRILEVLRTRSER